MVGERLRQARVARQLSLADVAGEANVSAATLSRVERDKQAIDVELLLTLAKVLNAAPADLIDDNGVEGPSLAVHIAAMQSGERTALWRALGTECREQRLRRRGDSRNMQQEVEELLAQADFLREEIESMRSRLAKKR